MFKDKFKTILFIYIYVVLEFGWPMVRPVLLCVVIFRKKIILQYKRNFGSVY